MNIEDIVTFLKIVELNSISAAAQSLFISQSSASTRINNLESNLGVKLIYRHKGYKKIELTQEGQYFLAIAQQWLALYNDAKNISNLKQSRLFHVVANATLTYYLLTDIYHNFTLKYPYVLLQAHTEHSTEAHNSVANQTGDIAIVYNQHYEHNIISKPLFKENMVFLVHKDSQFAKTKNLNDLQDIHEIKADWSSDFELWHQRTFPYFTRPKIIIGSSFMFVNFLQDVNDWAIVSQIIADAITKQKPEYIAITSNKLPQREAYIISHKYPKPGIKEIQKLFIDELLDTLKDNKNIELLY